MRKMFILFLLLLGGCSSYPDGESGPQKLSYQGGDIQVWQTQFRQTLLDSLELQDSRLTQPLHPQDLNSSIQPIDFTQSEYATLAELIQPYKSQAQAQAFCDKNSKTLFYTNSNSPTTNGIKINDCEGLLSFASSAVTLFDVRIRSADGYALRAYLLWPAEVNENASRAQQKTTPFLYWHGHGSDRNQAAFDFTSYHKAIGFRMAKQGFLTLVPDIRTFELGNKQHYKLTKQMKDDHPNLFAKWIGDGYLWGQWLRLADLNDFSLPQTTFNRENLQIAGTSLGSQIALWLGALDTNYQAVTTVGGFYGFEVLFSKNHHGCQHVPQLLGLGNIMDVALMIWPRHLHIGMGGKDKFYNGYSKTAWEFLKQTVVKLGGTTCEGDPQSISAKLLPKEQCQTSFEFDAAAGHELTTTLTTFQILAGQQP